MPIKKDKENGNKYVDVAVVGGGLAGLSLACLIGQAGLKVAIIDKADPSTPMTGDERTTAISYGSSRVLAQAGIWDKLESLGNPIRDIKILDGDSPVLLRFLSEEVEDKEFGTILLNSDIRKILNKKISNLPNIELLAPEDVRDFKIHDGAVDVILNSGLTLQAKLAIGADGRQSFMRQWLDIETRQWSYDQTAVVCLVSHEKPHHDIAVEHFWPDGPFAILPMADDQNGKHRSSLVFTVHGDRKDKLMGLSKESFNSILRDRFPEEYGHVEMLGERSAYPLSLVHAAHYIGERMVLIADAAHGIHPIAGQGLNLGFRDVKELARLIITAHEKGQDVGSKDLLETYQRRRRPDNMAMVAVTDGLVRLFSNNSPPLRLVRRLGLRAVSKLPPAKRFFMRQAMADRE